MRFLNSHWCAALYYITNNRGCHLRNVQTVSLHTPCSVEREERLSTGRPICSTSMGRSYPPTSDKHCRYSSETRNKNTTCSRSISSKSLVSLFTAHPAIRPCLKRTAPLNRREHLSRTTALSRPVLLSFRYNILQKMSSVHRIVHYWVSPAQIVEPQVRGLHRLLMDMTRATATRGRAQSWMARL